MTTATATTTLQIKDLIGWVRKNNRAARAARFLVQLIDVVCRATTWNFHSWGSDDNWARGRRSLIICIYMKTIRTMQAKVHFAYFVLRDQHGIIAIQIK